MPSQTKKQLRAGIARRERASRTKTVSGFTRKAHKRAGVKIGKTKVRSYKRYIPAHYK